MPRWYRSWTDNIDCNILMLVHSVSRLIWLGTGHYLPLSEWAQWLRQSVSSAETFSLAGSYQETSPDMWSLTAAFAPEYSGNDGIAWMPTILDVATMKPPGVGFCRIKCIESCVPYINALKTTSVQFRSGSAGSLKSFNQCIRRHIIISQLLTPSCPDGRKCKWNSRQ